MERRNPLGHFQIQEDNYAATLKTYTEMMELLIKQQADEIEKLLKKMLKLQIESCPLG